MIKIKKELLERMINNDIKDIKYSRCLDSSFCIHIDDGIEVHIKITCEEGELFHEVLPEYEEK